MIFLPLDFLGDFVAAGEINLKNICIGSSKTKVQHSWKLNKKYENVVHLPFELIWMEIIFAFSEYINWLIKKNIFNLSPISGIHFMNCWISFSYNKQLYQQHELIINFSWKNLKNLQIVHNQNTYPSPLWKTSPGRKKLFTHHGDRIGEFPDKPERTNKKKSSPKMLLFWLVVHIVRAQTVMHVYDAF